MSIYRVTENPNDPWDKPVDCDSLEEAQELREELKPFEAFLWVAGEEDDWVRQETRTVWRRL